MAPKSPRGLVVALVLAVAWAGDVMAAPLPPASVGVDEDTVALIIGEIETLLFGPDHADLTDEALAAQLADLDSRASETASAPKMIRLAFHDCVGGCDGCLDVSDPDNAGLEFGIDQLEPIVQAYPYETSGLTRGDIWALAGLTAARVSQDALPGARGYREFVLESSGRPDCGDDFKAGPVREMPQAYGNAEYVMSYFAEQFGLDNKTEIAALMGAHSVGQAHPAWSGFNGTWTNHQKYLTNSYYNELLVGPWLQTVVNGEDETTDVFFQWQKDIEFMAIVPATPIPSDEKGAELDTPAGPTGEARRRRFHRKLSFRGADKEGTNIEEESNGYLMMLNADMALVLDFDAEDYVQEDGIYPFYNGEVKCTYETCGESFFLEAVKVYAGLENKEAWINDFELSYKKILETVPADYEGTLVPIAYTIDPEATPVPVPTKPLCGKQVNCPPLAAPALGDLSG